MNIPWVCASCRRHLFHRYQRQLRYQQRATYISFGKGTTSGQESEDANTRGRSKRHKESRRTTAAGTQTQRNIPTLELLQSAENEFMERLLSRTNHGGNDTGGLYSRKLLKEQIPQPPAPTQSAQFPAVTPPPGSARSLRPLPSNVVSLKGLRSNYKSSKEGTGSVDVGNGANVQPITMLSKSEVPATPTISSSPSGGDAKLRQRRSQPDDGALEQHEQSTFRTKLSSSPRWGQYAKETKPRVRDSALPSASNTITSRGHGTADTHVTETVQSDTIPKSVTDKSDSAPWLHYLRTEHDLTDDCGIQASLQQIFDKWDNDSETPSHTPLSTVFQTFLDRSLQHRLPMFSWLISIRLLLRMASSHIVSGNLQAHKSLNKYKLELFTLWNLLLKAPTELVKVGTDDEEVMRPTAWEQLSKIVETTNIVVTEPYLYRRLGQFFPSMVNSNGKPWQDVDLIAVATLAFLQHDHARFSSSPYHTPDVEELCKFISLVAKSSTIRKGWKHARAIYLGQRKIDESAIGIIKQVFLSLTADKQLPIEQSKSMSTTISTARLTETQLDHRIGRAVEARDPGQVAALWDKLCTRRTDFESASSIAPALFTQFLTAFMAVRMPSRALEVWNTMVSDGVIPDIRAWDAMLKGCGVARDAQAVDDLWMRFLQSGIKPDAQIWATRIHALTTSGHWESGIAAFQQMASNWISAVKKGHKKEIPPDLKMLGDCNDTPKPSTFVLNGLITGLARGKKHEHLEKVFSWAQRLGIPMDAHSFNPILATAVRRGDGATGMEILDQMKGLGATPDIATYTLLLQLLFRSDQSSPPVPSSDGPQFTSTSTTSSTLISNRSQAAAKVLQMMHSSNIAANPYTYATLIHGVLHNPHSSPSQNLSAAYAVLTYMESQSIPLSSQVYTNFLSHHFSQSPPDLAAIEALWSRARQDRLVFLDNFFFDRLIEGFAKCGEVGKMMAALGHASKRAKVPSWRAMTEVIKALSKDGDHMRAEEIVASVKRDDMEQDQRRPKTGRETFWQTVHELGLTINLQNDLSSETL